MKESALFNKAINMLISSHGSHAPSNIVNDFLKIALRNEVEALFSSTENLPIVFEPFGIIYFPYHKMGNVDSLNLFDIDELIIFSFYWHNKKKYKKALDIGANIGLHSLIMNKCGIETISIEPDPVHFSLLRNNLDLNGFKDCRIINSAMSSKSGKAEFIRVLGNTTSSHLAGAKKAPYGDLERFSVDVVSINDLLDNIDLIKLDAEGQEVDILQAIEIEKWKNIDALVEVGTEENTNKIYEHFIASGINMFAQKINWNKVENLEDMPTSYKDGTLFISSKLEMPWS